MNESRSLFKHYYRVYDSDGDVRLETVYQDEALAYVAKKLEEEQVLCSIEQIDCNREI